MHAWLEVPAVRTALEETLAHLQDPGHDKVIIPVASCCSGLGVAEMVFNGINTFIPILLSGEAPQVEARRHVGHVINLCIEQRSRASRL